MLIMILCSVVSNEDEVLPFHADGDGGCDRNADGDGGPRSRTPPTPPVEPSRLSRIPANASLRPVSIPEVVRDMAGPNPIRAVADFDRHYMPQGAPEPYKSVRGNADEHRSQLKRKANDISRSYSEVFSYLTQTTKSQSEAKELLEMITNVTIHSLFQLYKLITLFNLNALCFTVEFRSSRHKGIWISHNGPSCASRHASK